MQLSTIINVVLEMTKKNNDSCLGFIELDDD